MKSCCFTGHRILKVTPELVSRVRETIIDLYRQGVTKFYNGAALGFDQLSAKAVIELKSSCTDIKLHIFLPCPAEEQVEGWNKMQIAEYMMILDRADSVTVLSEHYTEDCMKQRNKRLVELADCCICYCANPRSGTGQTVRMAREKGIYVIDLC